MISVVFAVVCFFIMSALNAVMIRQDLESEKERYGFIARNEAEHIVTVVDCVMARTSTLKAMIRDHNGDTAFFDSVAADIYNDVLEETGVALKNFAVAPDCVVSDVYPLAGNEALIGFHFLDTSRAGNLEAMEAYTRGKTILTNPFELVQGGLGMGGRSPVIMKNGDETVVWGLVTVTIDFDNLMEVLKLDNLKGMGVEYALSYLDADGESHVMRESGNLDGHEVKTRFQVRNLTWELAVSPEKGWISVWRILLSEIVLMILAGFLGVFTSMLLRLRETNGILLRLSNTDSLTGSFNRRAYENAISAYEEKPVDADFVYVSADLNGLKHTNDTLGHLAGDELINGAHVCIQETLGAYGTIYRIGGDEFVALIHADEQSVEGILEKLEKITKTWKGKCVKELSISVGYASRREFPEADLETLIRKADERMYDAKQEYYTINGLDRRRR